MRGIAITPAPRQADKRARANSFFLILLDLAESWRVIPEAVEDIYRYCKPMRFNADAPANDG